MPNSISPLSNIRLLEDLSRKETMIHRLHPLAKLLTTVLYLTVVVSFGRYEISSLLPLIIYPVVILELAELPLVPILRRILPVGVLMIGLGILNPLLDQQTVVVVGVTISRGWLTFFSIIIKSSLTVAVGILLIATTGIDRLAAALRLIKVPKIFVLQLLLTYRYIAVLGEEVSQMIRAYELRAPGQKGIQRSAWGSFAGQLLLRTFGRAQRVYQAMSLRGFTGEYHPGDMAKIAGQDWTFLVGWSVFFVLMRFYDIPALLGTLFMGVLK